MREEEAFCGVGEISPGLRTDTSGCLLHSESRSCERLLVAHRHKAREAEICTSLAQTAQTSAKARWVAGFVFANSCARWHLCNCSGAYPFSRASPLLWEWKIFNLIYLYIWCLHCLCCSCNFLSGEEKNQDLQARFKFYLMILILFKLLQYRVNTKSNNLLICCKMVPES